MEDWKRFKVWYFDSHEKIIAEDIIKGTPETTLEIAKLFASNIADSHYPECVRIECLELGKEKTPVLEH